MITIVEYPHIKLYWHDDDQSILVEEVNKGWVWSDAQQALNQLNETVGIQADSHLFM
jgi:hypothetical protein